MNFIRPALSIDLARFRHVLQDGSEVEAGEGLRVLLRYPGSKDHDQTFEIIEDNLTYMADGRLHWNLSPAELVEFVGNQNDVLGDLIQFGEENLAGIWFSGEEFHWEALAMEGYQFRSPSKAQATVPSSPAPR